MPDSVMAVGFHAQAMLTTGSGVIVNLFAAMSLPLHVDLCADSH